MSFDSELDSEQLMASEPVLSSVKWEECWYLSCRIDNQRGMMWSNFIHTQALKMLIFLSPQIPLLAESSHLSLGRYCFLSTLPGFQDSLSQTHVSLWPCKLLSKYLWFGALNTVIHTNRVVGGPLLFSPWRPGQPPSTLSCSNCCCSEHASVRLSWCITLFWSECPQLTLSLAFKSS